MEALLCQEGETLWDYSHLLDDRAVQTKRTEFSKIREAVFSRKVASNGATCQLLYAPEECEGEARVLDHLIPASTNVLNKRRGVQPAEPGRKVPTMSLGSNHPANLVLACDRCNSRKKHNFPYREIIARLFHGKSF